MVVMNDAYLKPSYSRREPADARRPLEHVCRVSPRVRARIQETEWLMRPPTPEERLCLQQAMQRLKEQEAYLAAMLGVATPPGVCDPSLNGETPVIPSKHGHNLLAHRHFW
jgi:hypothetical protein